MDEPPRSSSHVPVNALTGTFIFRARTAKARLRRRAQRWHRLLLIFDGTSGAPPEFNAL